MINQHTVKAVNDAFIAHGFLSDEMVDLHSQHNPHRLSRLLLGGSSHMRIGADECCLHMEGVN